MKFQLPTLAYSFDSLEPYIDSQTMQIHYTKHHQAYIDNLNKAITDTKFANSSILEILQHLSQLPAVIRNNGGGHWNHSFFWESLKPNSAGPSEKLSQLITKNFTSFEEFKKQFIQSGMTRFGSGWAWLIKQDDKLTICSTPNQDNPLMDIAEVKGQPLLGVDVWEHAYYLKYQNRRAEYLEAFWQVINWDMVEQRLG